MGATLFDVEAELRDLAARRDIQDCVCRYMRGQDRLDAALQRSAFHDDAYVDCGPLAGRPDAYVAYAQGELAKCAFTQHLIGQMQLRVEGHAAYGEIYFIAYHRMQMEGVDTDMIFGGRYIDEYARRDGDWRIVRRREIADWTRTDPASDGFFALEPNYHRGGRRGPGFRRAPRLATVSAGALSYPHRHCDVPRAARLAGADFRTPHRRTILAIEGIHHFAISTPDIDRLIAFYRDMFGFACVFDSTWGEGSDTIDAMLGRRGTVARVAMLRTQTGFLELFQFSAPEPVPARPDRSQIDHGYTHFCVNVTGIDAEYQRLLQAGVRFHAPPASMAPPLMAAYCRDPDDNVIELLEILDESWPFHFSRRAGDPAHG